MRIHSQSPTPLSQSDELRNLTYRFVQHLPVAIFLGVLCALGGLLYAQRYRPAFHSEAQVRVGDELDARSIPGQREDQSELADLPDNLASAFRARIVVDSKLKALLAQLAMRPQLSHLAELRTPTGQSELAEHIKRQLLVEPVTRRIFKLSYDAKDPDLAQQVVQALAELGVNDVIQQRTQTTARASAFLSEETERARQRMLDAETQVVNFVRTHPKLLVTMSGTDRNKLGLQGADKLLATGRAAKAAPTPLKELEASANSPEAMTLLTQKSALEAQVSQIEAGQRLDPVQQKLSEAERVQQQISDLKTQGYTAEYPEFRRLSSDLERIQQEVRDLRRKKDPRLAEDMMSLNQARAQIAAIDRQLAMVRRKLAGSGKLLRPDDQALPAEAEYARFYRDLENARTAYEKLREREQDAQISEQLSKVASNPAARIEDPAQRPLGPRGVSRKMMTALCIAIGLMLGGVYGVGRAATDAHIYTVFDLSRSSRLPVLGRLTSPRKDGTDHAFDFHQPEVVPALPQNNRALPAVPQLLTLRRTVRQPVSQTRASQPALQPSALSQGKVSLSGGIDAGALPPNSAEGVASQSSPLPDEYVVLYEQDLLSSASASSASEGRAQSSESQPPSSKSGGIHLAGLGYRIRLCELPKNPPPELTLLAAPQGARAEQLRLLRCRLEEQQDPRVLLFTSAKPGEGKTLCAANLALAYAEGGGAKVVLVDAHLSSGKLSKLLGAVAPSPGASESAKSKGRDSKRSPTAQAAEPTHLAGGCPEVLQLQPNLFLVPASSLGAAASRAEILRSPAFAKLLSDLRESFDYVLIDTPAISEAADAKLVLRYADAGLLLVRAGKSTSSVIAAALGRLGRQGLTGAVLNELT